LFVPNDDQLPCPSLFLGPAAMASSSAYNYSQPLPYSSSSYGEPQPLPRHHQPLGSSYPPQHGQPGEERIDLDNDREDLLTEDEKDEKLVDWGKMFTWRMWARKKWIRELVPRSFPLLETEARGEGSLPFALELLSLRWADRELSSLTQSSKRRELTVAVSTLSLSPAAYYIGLIICAVLVVFMTIYHKEIIKVCLL
jgi:hypothetical protein